MLVACVRAVGPLQHTLNHSFGFCNHFSDSLTRKIASLRVKTIVGTANLRFEFLPFPFLPSARREQNRDSLTRTFPHQR